jgi:pimeloyl-ACP methyl ester carboxylesterase
LHGLLSSLLEYTYVIPYLTAPSPSPSTANLSPNATGYHILVPHVPGHGPLKDHPSSNFANFSIPTAADSVAALIEAKAKNGRAHVVGLSLGGFIGLNLSLRYPDLVSSLFVTGVAGVAEKPWLLRAAPWMVWGLTAILYCVPNVLFSSMMKSYGLQMPAGLREEMLESNRWALLSSAYGGIGETGTPRVKSRTAVVAGGKQDDVGAAGVLGRVMRGEVKGAGVVVGGEEEREEERVEEGAGDGNEQSKAYVVDGAVHAWDLQFPELFAKGVRAWVEGGEMPGEFRELR